MSDDIRRWLEELNLGQFAESFAANGIELSLLPDLNNDDLKDMGVARVADRKKVLNAIAALKAPVPPAHAERRQLSVMFCDLVGSTELSARLDPEDMREVLRRYQDTVAGVIIRHDGYVANYLGDGVLAYFGWPTAHEDQAQRAVRAALGAVAAVGEIRTPADQPLAARAGIATDQVVVGDLETETGRQSGAISGETPNRAAGIQGEAAPGEVFIGAATRRLLGTAFQVTERGERKLKGLVEPEALWAVAGETFVESRFAAQHRGSLTPFIGREREVDLLAERWRRARDGQGQVVSLSGEAGIGKSRLAQVTREHAAVQDPTVLQYQCAPSFANSAFYPFVQQLGHAAGFAKDDAPDQKLDKLETVTGGSARPAAQTHSLLAAMMQIPIGERYPPLKLTPDQMLHETGSVLVEQLHALAEQRPVLMIFEDLHWADGNSLALLERTIAALSTWPVLAVFTYRPEFEPSWQPSDHHAVVALERLDRDRCRDMVLRVSGDARLPDAVLDQILDRTDGVPLFVEELVKTVLESDVAADAEAGAGGEWASLAIPSTLQDSLIARLEHI